MIHLLLPIAVLLIALSLLLPAPAWAKTGALIAALFLAGVVIFEATFGAPQQRVMNEADATMAVMYSL